MWLKCDKILKRFGEIFCKSAKRVVDCHGNAPSSLNSISLLNERKKETCNSWYARHTLHNLPPKKNNKKTKHDYYFLGVEAQWKLLTEDYVMGVTRIINSSKNREFWMRIGLLAIFRENKSLANFLFFSRRQEKSRRFLPLEYIFFSLDR